MIFHFSSRLEPGTWKGCRCGIPFEASIQVCCPICEKPFWLRGYELGDGKIKAVTCGNPECEFESDIELKDFPHGRD